LKPSFFREKRCKILGKTVAIIIPARNEKDFIGECLDSFINQTYPKELLKIYVCDGMSDDGTREIINEYNKKYSNVFLVDNPGRTAPKGMNEGIRKSHSDIVIIFGAHSFAEPDFVAENVKSLENPEVGCSGGTARTINEGVKGEAIALAMSCPFGVGNAIFRYAEKEAYVDTVGFGAYKREVLDKIGLFDEELVRNQDDELNFRVTKSGYKILLNPKIKYSYYSRPSLSKLWKQYYQYGFWKVRVIQKHKKPAALRHLVPMLFVSGLIGTLVLSLFSKLFLYAFLAIVIAYLAGVNLFAYKICKKEGLKYYKYLPLTFFILHASYGTGFLQGIINFYLFKNEKMISKNTSGSR